MWHNKRTRLGATAFLLLALTSACGSEEATDVQSIAQALGGEYCLASDAGKYCGDDNMTGADPSTLYFCPGGAWTAPTSATHCPYGCVTAAAGKNDYCASAPPAPASPLMMSSTDLAILQNGNYTSGSCRLLFWDYDFVNWRWGGSGLSATHKWAAGDKTETNDPNNTSGYEGQCVSFVKALAHSTSNRWVQGDNVVASGGSIPIGTAIATFSGGRYSGHAAFLAGYVRDSGTGAIIGLELYDENWCSPLLVGAHTLRVTGSGSISDASSYYVAKASS